VTRAIAESWKELEAADFADILGVDASEELEELGVEEVEFLALAAAFTLSATPGTSQCWVDIDLYWAPWLLILGQPA